MESLLTSGDGVVTIAASRAVNGANQSSLQFDSQANASTETNLQAAAGQISNVDVASEGNESRQVQRNGAVRRGHACASQPDDPVALKLIQ